MRHFLLLPLLLAVGAPGVAAPAPASDAAPGSDCRNRLQPRPAHPRGPLRLRMLGEMPPGDLMLAVYRTENGCPVSTVVSQGIGAVGQPAEPLSGRRAR